MKCLETCVSYKDREVSCFEVRIYKTRAGMHAGIRTFNRSYDLHVLDKAEPGRLKKGSLAGVEAMMIGAPCLVRTANGAKPPQPWGSGILFFHEKFINALVVAHELSHYVTIVLRPLLNKFMRAKSHSAAQLKLDEDIAEITGELTKLFWTWYYSKKRKDDRRKGGKKKC